MSEEEFVSPMHGMNEEEKKEYIIGQAMSIIMNAGDARNFAAEARDLIGEGKYDEAEAKIKEAEKVQTEAHVTQTEMIQGDVRGGEETLPYNVLFAHAQDTLMTIQVEINLTKSMIKMARQFEERLKK